MVGQCVRMCASMAVVDEEVGSPSLINICGYYKQQPGIFSERKKKKLTISGQLESLMKILTNSCKRQTKIPAKYVESPVAIEVDTRKLHG